MRLGLKSEAVVGTGGRNQSGAWSKNNSSRSSENLLFPKSDWTSAVAFDCGTGGLLRLKVCCTYIAMAAKVQDSAAWRKRSLHLVRRVMGRLLPLSFVPVTFSSFAICTISAGS